MKQPELSDAESAELAEIAELNPAMYRRIMAQIALIDAEVTIVVASPDT
jgi:hypothetical protein